MPSSHLSEKGYMSLIYQLIGEEPFNDFDNVQYKQQEFYKKQKTQGLHPVRYLVDLNPRKTILLPYLFELFDSLYF